MLFARYIFSPLTWCKAKGPLYPRVSLLYASPPLAQDSGDSEGQIGRVSASSIGRTWLPCSGLRAPASPRDSGDHTPHTAPRGDCHRTSCTTVLYSPLRRCRPRGGPLRVLVVNVVAFRTRCTSKVRHSFSVLYEVSLLDRSRHVRDSFFYQVSLIDRSRHVIQLAHSKS